MVDKLATRRRFLGKIGLLGASGAALASPLDAQAQSGAMTLSFRVAGSRFHMPSDFRPTEGDPVLVVRAEFDGRCCFEVRTAAEGRIGYVPADLVPVFERARSIGAKWDRYDPELRRSVRLRVVAELTLS